MYAPDPLWQLLRQVCCWCAVLLAVCKGAHALKLELPHKVHQLTVSLITLTREACRHRGGTQWHSQLHTYVKQAEDRSVQRPGAA